MSFVLFFKDKYLNHQGAVLTFFETEKQRVRKYFLLQHWFDKKDHTFAPQ